MVDHSLDDFLTAADQTVEAPESDDGSTVEAPESAAAETVAPTTATYRFSPDGDVCPRCGETVETRWRDDDAFVCFDCKEW